MWSGVSRHDVLAEDVRHLTPVASCADKVFSHALRGGTEPLDKILPTAPSASDSAGHTFHRARNATARLGLPWPYEPHRPGHQGPVIEEVPEVAADDDVALLVDVVFALLAPGYAPEVLSLSIVKCG